MPDEIQEVTFYIRTGLGTVKVSPPGEVGRFTDEVGTATRAVRQMAGWQCVMYKGQRYQLFGGAHVYHFINLLRPLSATASPV